MIQIRSPNTSPPGGFRFVDKPTGFRAHGWSIGSAASQWYHEQLRRGKKITLESCRGDVEQYTCTDLMKSPGWENFVLVTGDRPAFIPSVKFQQVNTDVSVVVPVYHANQDRISKVITAVKDQCTEILLVHENGSDAGSGKLSYVLAQPDAGFGTKCNYGAQKSKAPFIWFLNDDCYPLPGCAGHLVNVMLANPKIGMVGHLLRYPNGFIQHGGTERVKGRVGFPHRDLGKLHPTLKVPTEMEAVTAASVMVRREAFEAVGGFDEGYFLYLEDSDLCLKMRQSGWKVYFTPFAEALHEEHASSKTRPGLDKIIEASVDRFTQKWELYFRENPETPTFEDFETVSQTPTIDALYVHLVGGHESEQLARKFVDSVMRFPPGGDVNWVVACNSASGDQLSNEMRSVFDRLGCITYFQHDNSGWDIGAFQAYSKVSKAELCLFFGSSAYCRHKDWSQRMIMAYRLHGPNAIYGVTGNLGNAACNVAPHLRTTGFWCKPEILAQYPHIVATPGDRYPFEHGPQGMTMWAWSQGYQVYVVETESIYAFPDWDNGPQGFHRGQQAHVLFGDRVCAPPYHPHP